MRGKICFRVAVEVAQWLEHQPNTEGREFESRLSPHRGQYNGSTNGFGPLDLGSNPDPLNLHARVIYEDVPTRGDLLKCALQVAAVVSND